MTITQHNFACSQCWLNHIFYQLNSCRIEQQGLDFFHRTRQRYLELVQNNPKAAIINAGQPLAQVQTDIQSAVKNWWVSQAK